MSIKSKIRTIPNFPIKGIKFRDISTLIGDPEGLNIVINRFRERYKNKDGFDFIAGIEARGFIVGSALAYALNKGFIMIRKPDKLPGKVVAEERLLENLDERIRALLQSPEGWIYFSTDSGKIYVIKP